MVIIILIYCVVGVIITTRNHSRELFDTYLEGSLQKRIFFCLCQALRGVTSLRKLYQIIPWGVFNFLVLFFSLGRFFYLDNWWIWAANPFKSQYVVKMSRGITLLSLAKATFLAVLKRRGLPLGMLGSIKEGKWIYLRISLAQRYLRTAHLGLFSGPLHPLVAVKGVPGSRVVDALKASWFGPDKSLSFLPALQ